MIETSELTAEDLRGGLIGDVVEEALSPCDETYAQKLGEVAGFGVEVLDAFERSFGWRPPAELAEYIDAEAALRASVEEVDEWWPDEIDGWMFGLDLCPLDADVLARGELFDWAEDLTVDTICLLCGMVVLGMDACGDTCFVSLLPHPDDIAEVWVYDHEVGHIDHHLGYSISDALLSGWLDDDEDLYRDKVEGWLGEDWRCNRPDWLVGRELERRTSWLRSLMGGRPGFAFEKRLGDAPDFDAWLQEKPHLHAHPHLAFYWTFAHYFLGNEAACREALEAARGAGSVGARLALTVEGLLVDPSASLAEIDAARLAELRVETHKNVMPAQIAPDQREQLAVERGEHERVDPGHVERLLSLGQTPLDVIDEFADDVELHDRMLDVIAEDDPAFAEHIEAYRRNRKRDAYNEWPWGDEPVDERLFVPIGAAFRSGLKFGESHASSFAGMTRTLAKIDQAVAMDAYEAAVAQLEADDGRLEYVIDQLGASDHRRAWPILEHAARRFLEDVEALDDSRENEAGSWPVLDNIFRGQDYFIGALTLVLDVSETAGAERAEAQQELARQTLAARAHLPVIGYAWGEAMQVVAAYEMDDLVDLAAEYIERVGDAVVERQPDRLADTTVFNVAECSRTLALRAPERARALLRRLFEGDYPSDPCRADIIGSVLAGLLVVEPQADDVLARAERVLASRAEDRPMRLYGALRGIEAAELRDAAGWVRPHVWDGLGGLSEQRSVVGEAARHALQALGVADLPRFDDTDAYALDLEEEGELLDALDLPHLYEAESVFERLDDLGIKSERVAARLGDWLVDSLRYAVDDHDRQSSGDRWGALRVLLQQGESATDQLARLFALEHLGGEWLGNLIQVARCSALDGQMNDWLRAAGDEELVAALWRSDTARPEPRWVPFLDHLAAEALLRQAPGARQAVRAAARWRFDFVETYSMREDLVAARLPRVLAMFGDLDQEWDDLVDGLGVLALDHWKRAREVDGIPTRGKEWDGAEELVVEATGDPDFGPSLVRRVELDAASVVTTTRVGDFYLQGVLEGNQWSATHRIDCRDEAAARDVAQRLARRLSVLGFTDAPAS